MNLEALRTKRRDRLGIKCKNHPSEYAGIRRIHFIFERACRKFHGDLDLWIEYIQFAKKAGSTKIAGKVFARAIQFHPRNPRIWIMAAAWEWEENSNVKSARVLLQRALRMNPDSQELWLEYFKLEILFLVKIAERQKVLSAATGEPKKSDAGEEPNVVVEDAPDASDDEAGIDAHELPDVADGDQDAAQEIKVCHNDFKVLYRRKRKRI
jgi:U3 small nucleolar RNA-associated protein 6